MPSEGNKMQLNKEEYKNFKQIVNIFYNEEIEGINEDKEKDITASINAKNNETTVTTTNTDKNAFRICSLIGKITFDNSALE